MNKMRFGFKLWNGLAYTSCNAGHTNSPGDRNTWGWIRDCVAISEFRSFEAVLEVRMLALHGLYCVHYCC